MRLVTTAMLVLLASTAAAQTTVSYSTGSVARAPDPRRLATQVPVPDASRRERARVSGDSAQRLAMHDMDWRGRVLSVELDEDERLYWDVKIAPDSAPRTILRYRVDAGTAGIIGIREFTDVGRLARRKP
jgi:hypothetical protein